MKNNKEVNCKIKHFQLFIDNNQEYFAIIQNQLDKDVIELTFYNTIRRQRF